MDDSQHDTDASAGEPLDDSALRCGDVVPGDKQLLRSCVLLVSCDPFLPTQSVSNCIHLNSQSSTLEGQCTKNARSCEDIWRCLRRYAPLRRDTKCGPLDTGWRCDGDLATRCDPDNQRVLLFNCAELGATCEIYPSGVVPDSTAPCRTPIPESCAKSATGAHCQANYLYTCVNGVPYGEDCTLRNALCDETSMPGTAYCREPAPSCSNAAEVSCDEDTLVACMYDGWQRRFDCGGVGNSCVTTSFQQGYCLPPGCSVEDVSSCREHCEGERLALCGDLKISCEELGFSRCVEALHPVLNAAYVACGM